MKSFIILFISISFISSELIKEDLGNGIYYIGVNDDKITLFEGQYPVEHGMAYNSYLVKDENEIAVIDTVDKHFKDEWLENIRKQLNDKKPKYLIIQHMEPDHSACIDEFVKKYPEVTVVSSKKAFAMMVNFFHN